MRTNKATPKKTEAEKAFRRARTAALKEANVGDLKAEAKTKGLQVGGTKAELVARIVRAEFSPAKRQKITLTAARAQITAKKKSALQGRGPFRLLILNEQGAAVANLGPYAAARGAQADAKTILRRMVGQEAALSHKTAEEQMPGLVKEIKKMTGGLVVDGWVAVLQTDDGDEELEELGSAWVIKFNKDDEKAFAGGKTPKTLRNPTVSFQTKNGPVSFQTRTRARRALGVRVNGSRRELTDAQSREVNSLYEQGRRAVDRLTAHEPRAFVYWQDILIYAIGNDYRVDRFLHAVEMGDADGLFVDDRAKGHTIYANLAHKVTWSDFTKAINALRRAMR